MYSVIYIIHLALLTRNIIPPPVDELLDINDRFIIEMRHNIRQLPTLMRWLCVVMFLQTSRMMTRVRIHVRRRPIIDDILHVCI